MLLFYLNALPEESPDLYSRQNPWTTRLVWRIVYVKSGFLQVAVLLKPSM